MKFRDLFKSPEQRQMDEANKAAIAKGLERIRQDDSVPPGLQALIEKIKQAEQPAPREIPSALSPQEREKLEQELESKQQWLDELIPWQQHYTSDDVALESRLKQRIEEIKRTLERAAG